MYFRGGWPQFAEDHDLHQGLFMLFNYHCGTSKFDVKIFDCTQCQKKYEAEVDFQKMLSSSWCNPFVCAPWSTSVIIICDELCLCYRPYYETKGTINVLRYFTLALMCFCLSAGRTFFVYLSIHFIFVDNSIITREKT
jgi:hypothetical protein